MSVAKLLIVLTLVFWGRLALAQTDSVFFRIYKPDIDRILGQEKLYKSQPKVSIAGFTPNTLRETPGVVSLITEQDIKDMGAKDLQDILRLIPGFDAALDFSPILTFRGNATNEAKMLVTIDGIPINDNSFGYNYLMNRFPLNQIERIEIIRGPGSAIYGGMAGLGVINIISKTKPDSKLETNTQALIGATRAGFMRHQVSFFSNFRPNENVEIGLSAANMDQKVTDRPQFTNAFFSRIVANDVNFLQSGYLNASFRIKKLSLQYFYTGFTQRFPLLLDARLNSKNHMFRISHSTAITDNISLYSRLIVRYGEPYLFSDAPVISGQRVGLSITSVNESKALANAYLLFQPKQQTTFVLGGEAWSDWSRYVRDGILFLDSTRSANFLGYNIFGELALKHKIANLTFGGRYEAYANVKPIFVPRFALTKTFSKLHFKTIFNQAFKTPTIQNIKNTIQPSMKPEKIRQIEVEVGWMYSQNFSLSLNAYDLIISDYILRKDLISVDAEYVNLGRSHTRGIEAEASLKGRKWMIKGSYSTFVSLEAVSIQTIPRLKSGVAAIPAHKANWILSLKPIANLNLNLNGFYITNKFGDSPFTSIKEHKGELHLNAYFSYNHFLTRNLQLGIGIHNLLDGDYWVATWKVDANGILDLPYQSREFYIRLAYSLKN